MGPSVSAAPTDKVMEGCVSVTPGGAGSRRQGRVHVGAALGLLGEAVAQTALRRKRLAIALAPRR